MARAMAKPAGDFIPHLKTLVQFNDIPTYMPPRNAIAITNELGKLPKEEVLEILSSMKAESNWHEHRRKFKDLLVRQEVPDTVGLKRPIVEKKSSPDVFISAPGTAKVTMIVFNVAGTKPGAPLATFDQQLALRGIRAIYLSDLKHQAFARGVKSLGPTQAAMHKFLREQIAEFPNDKVITLGASNSAVAAIATALALNLDGAISLAGFVSGATDFLASINDTRNPTLATQVADQIGEEADLRTWFNRYENRPQVHMHFAENKKFDRLHAEAIQEFENVSLHEWEGHVEHSLTSEMLLRGSFGVALDMMLAEI